MAEVYRVTPQPVAGEQGPTVIRWLDRYAQEQATAVAQMTVRDFPPWVVAQIDGLLPTSPRESRFAMAYSHP